MLSQCLCHQEVLAYLLELGTRTPQCGDAFSTLPVGYRKAERSCER